MSLVDTRQRKQFEAEYTGTVTYAASVAIIDMILRTALSWTIDDLDAWIEEFVPKRTGQLRESLHKNLRTSRVINRTLLKLYFGTHLDYADFVNDMTDSQVQHDGDVGYAYYYGHYGRITLDDPNALGNFFDHMINYARISLRNNIQRAIRTGYALPSFVRQNLINFVVVRRT